MLTVLAAVLGLLVVQTLVDCRGVDLGLCDDTRFQCRCGSVDPAYAVRLPIKQCTFFKSWKPYCRPCNKITTYDVCPKYINCHRCDENNEKDNRCTECPAGKYGNWCDLDCPCQNGATCDRNGQCYCTQNFEGKFCEKAKVIFCKAPPAPRNGYVDYSSTQSGSIAKYRCELKFRLSGPDTNRCSKDGQWEQVVPACVPVCKIPKDVPSHLVMELIYDSETDSSPPVTSEKLSSVVASEREYVKSIKFKCGFGYVLRGYDTITCFDGTWNGKIPTCIKFCAPVTQPQNGLVSPISERYLPESVVAFTCNTGYQVRGERSVKCQQDGTWSGNVPKCEPLILCDDPGTPEGGTRDVHLPFTAGKPVTYSCNNNSILIGDATIICLSNNEWSGKTPSCLTVSDKTITCDTTGNEVMGDENDPVRIQCPSECSQNDARIWGTVIYESSSSVCKAAIHSAKIGDEGGPVLVINNAQYAGFVSSIINNIVSESKNGFSSSFRFSSLPPKKFGEDGLTSECPEGWREVDDVCVLVVNKKKVWQQASEICRNLDTSLVEADEKKVIKLQPLLLTPGGRSYWFGRKCGVIKNDVEKRSLSIVENKPCDEARNFLCQIRLLSKGAKCLDPGDVYNANREVKNVINGVFYYGSSIRYKCKSLYYISGKESIKCSSNSEWDNPKPICRRIPACEELTPPINGILDYSEPPKESATASRSIVASRFGFPRIGFPKFGRGRFPLSLTAPTNITSLEKEIVNITIPEGYKKSGVRSEVICKSRFYKRTGSKVRTCRVNGRWSGSDASCNPICGVSSAPRQSFIVNGNTSDVGQWPWQVAISRWWPEKKYYVLVCGGSLLNENWILTAAHCVTYATSNFVVPNSQFKIHLGKHYRNDTLDDEFVQERRIEEIHVHADYDPVQYDSDIALIKLAAPVELSTRVRPVCLPTFKSSNEHLAAGKIGIVTGWGMSENKTFADDLQQARIPVVTRSTCVEGYRTEGIQLTITDYMFCAGYQRGKIDACSGDSGGPMVFQDAATRNWILEGIVSWGSPKGCGNNNQYGGFTRVERFLPWIQEFL